MVPSSSQLSMLNMRITKATTSQELKTLKMILINKRLQRSMT
ncbi:hypothetical protein NWP96_03920 [Mycoplasmopsis cynos]|nr:hypothetical protein [Mycoplasmopsis cynos]